MLKDVSADLLRPHIQIPGAKGKCERFCDGIREGAVMDIHALSLRTTIPSLPLPSVCRVRSVVKFDVPRSIRLASRKEMLRV
jgi:hypothetical protein